MILPKTRWLFLTIMIFAVARPVLAQDIPVLFPEPLSPRIANYNIDVKLDVGKKTLDGQEVLIWHNKSQDAITELQFHLYLNGFRNSESTFMQESGGRSRRNKLDEKGWGHIEVTSMKLTFGGKLTGAPRYLAPPDAPKVLDNAFDLTGDMQFIQPDNDNAEDKSVFSVPLPRPLQPGEFVAVNMDFNAKLPEPPMARTGAKEDYFFVGQWFPKVGVYTENGWNTHQFHANSEFFADYGVYNVRMTVPENYVLGATGVEVEVAENDDGTATHFYHAEDVHDFAWTTSPEFIEVTGKSQDVDIRVLMQPDHADQGERHLAATQFAVQVFQDWYGDYPFPNLTVVDPRRGAGGSGGMEYPTLVTAGTKYGLPAGIQAVEHVIIHEFGHNYWYHLLASNEFEESWMDEGINTYTDIQTNRARKTTGGDLIDFLGVQVDADQLFRTNVMFGAGRDPIMRRAWEYYSGGSYGVNSYAKPGIVLQTLHNLLGDEVMSKIMRTYVERWRFKHPKSQDFFDVVNEVSGQDMDWFIEQAWYTNATLDYSVTRVTTREVKKPKGFDYTLPVSESDSMMTRDEDEQTNIEVAAASAVPTVDEAAEPDSDDEPQETKLYFSEVRIRRLGQFQFPVEIEAVFDDGEVIREHWDGQELWQKYRYTRPAKLVSATVDPEGQVLLDVNFTNNSATVAQQKLGINKVSERWMFWMQLFLEQPDILHLLQMPRELIK